MTSPQSQKNLSTLPRLVGAMSFRQSTGVPSLAGCPLKFRREVQPVEAWRGAITRARVGTGRRAAPAARLLICAMFNSPQAFVPVIRIMQPDGSVLVKAGAPVISEPTISTREAAKALGLSIRTVSYQCEIGLFKTACKPGGTPRSPWRIAASEVQARRTFEC
jgi:hypothetical protein